jgi:hypothetical protein
VFLPRVVKRERFKVFFSGFLVFHCLLGSVVQEAFGNSSRSDGVHFNKWFRIYTFCLRLSPNGACNYSLAIDEYLSIGARVIVATFLETLGSRETIF